MFSKYFSQQQTSILKSKKNTPVKKPNQASKTKNLKAYRSFFSFLKDHLPYEYALATGKVRNHQKILSKNCDLLVYKKWCDAYLELSGGYVIVDDIYAFMTVEMAASPASLRAHVNLTSAMKNLKSSEIDAEKKQEELIPIYSVYFSYSSLQQLPDVKEALLSLCEEKKIPINERPDILCILDQGILVRDWEKGGDYRGLLTENETLMWFYILFLEHIDVKGGLSINLRNFVKSNRVYDEC